MTSNQTMNDATLLNRSERTTKQFIGEKGVEGEEEVLDLHVVLLINYVRKHHVASYQALAKRVRKLTILLSVPMEPDRDWNPEWSDLDVRVQKNWMFTGRWRHSTGFKEDNFIHVPIDTVSQLKKLNPDIVFSYEMGMRTLLSGWFRFFRRNIPLVMVGNMSEHIEKERGMMRRMMRGIVRRMADFFTYNGPSCKRYLKSIGIAEDKLFHVPYCIDDDVVFQGTRASIDPDRPRRLLYCGSISERKGLLPFTQALQRWLSEQPDCRVEFQVAGSGPLKEQLAQFGSDQLAINFLGNLDPSGLREAHANADIAVTPTFADEWGLTPIESLASGIPVLGSFYAQSVESVVRDDINGWVFRPDDPASLDLAIERALQMSPADLQRMAKTCRDSVKHISDVATAECFCQVIHSVLPDVKTTSSQIED
ncbi:MAG: glycosyltransferase family 4 protein [Planctomycetota bacterium]